MAKKKLTTRTKREQGSSKKKSTAPTKKSPSKTAGRVGRGKSYWLIKSEPDEFSIDDLANATDQTTHWDGVRNYQARNMLRDDMQIGDLVLFYHSNADPPGIAGIAKVVRAGYPDHTAFDPQDKHYDPKSQQSDPRWFMVDVQFVEKFPREIPLTELKQLTELEGMVLLQKGSRLSIQPVSPSHFKVIKQLGKRSRKA